MSNRNFNPSKDMPSLSGKVYLITGGTNGLGARMVESLATHSPSKLFFTGRNKSAAEALISRVKTSSPSTTLTFLPCDHKDLASVSACAKSLLNDTTRLDGVLCNAGIMATVPSLTKDKFEEQFQVNHLSHALLLKHLLPILRKTATSEPTADVRVVTMSSIAYQQAPSKGIDFATLHTDQASLGFPLGRWARYGQSKLANMLYAEQLAAHTPEITSVSVHPGVVSTDLFNLPMVVKLPVILLNIGKWSTVEEGTFNPLWALTGPKNAIKNGQYYEPVGQVGKRTTKQARNAKLGEELWRWTEQALEKY